MLLRKTITALLFCLPICATAQEKDITGLWKGTLFNDTTQKFYKYEIGISKEKGKYSGFSHTWFLIGDTQYFGVKKLSVKIAADGKIIVEDDGLIANNYPIAPNKGIRQLNVLTLDASDSLMKLTGPFSTNRTKQYHSLTGSIFLQRKNDFWQSALVPHLQELGREEELSFVKEEKQMLAKADAVEKQGQLAEREASTRAQKQHDEKEQQLLAQTKLAGDEKEKQLLAAAKHAELEKEKEAKVRNRQEIAKEQEVKKLTEEKERAEKLSAKQELAKQTEAEKKAAKQLAEKEKQEKIAAVEKAKLERGIAKQETKNQQDTEKKLQQRDDYAPGTVNKATEKPGPVPLFKINNIPAADVATRKTIVQQTVNFSSDSLQLSLYDNGEIDGDTVSVLMNGQLILARQGLGIKAIKHTIYIPSHVNTVEMVMYAETLGSIPPNTGLLVIRDGKDLYEVRFSGDLQKNASIVFNRKKE